jgi:hypothetical protein
MRRDGFPGGRKGKRGEVNLHRTDSLSGHFLGVLALLYFIDGRLYATFLLGCTG